MTTYDTVLSTGNPSNRVNISFLGDGYTASEISSSYVTAVNSQLDYLFDGSILSQPFGKYHNFFNAYRINVISNQSGADNPMLGTRVDTALDASYRWDGVTDRLLYISESKADAQINATLGAANIDSQISFVAVNSSTYGGGGGSYGVYAALNSSTKEVALHEIGHSFGLLADEYGDYSSSFSRYTGPEFSQPNITIDSTGAKWSQWLGYDQNAAGLGLGVVGAYEGGYYVDAGVYHPSTTSKMLELGKPFDVVSRETLIRQIYDAVDPIDSHTAAGAQTNPSVLVCDVIDPDVISVRWTVNGQVLQNGAYESFNCRNLAAGTYSITALAYDNTGWVRGDLSELQQSVSWTVTISGGTAQSQTFDAVAYAAMNADLFNAFGLDTTALVRHYISNGRAEGRTASGFDATAYAAMNSDLYSAFGLDTTALVRHYISNGRGEGRTASGFDATAYAAMNSDLYRAFGVNTSSLVSHYISNGRSEGRTATGFDAEAYAAMNSDLYSAFGLNVSSLVSHYVNNGRAEGRVANGFSADAYAAANSDVFSALGTDASTLVRHYINNGRGEGRSTGTTLSLAPPYTSLSPGEILAATG